MCERVVLGQAFSLCGGFLALSAIEPGQGLARPVSAWCGCPPNACASFPPPPFFLLKWRSEDWVWLR